ncbi:VP1, partial [hunnivirus A5]
GEETQVAPAETGNTPVLTAENSNMQVVDIPYTEKRLSHSAVRFWFDRFFLADQITVPSKGSAPVKVELSWDNITRRIPEVRWFTHATYIRFELEVAVRAYNQDEVEYEMVFYPPGTHVPDETTTWATTLQNALTHAGPCPRWSWKTKVTPVFTTRIPFCPVSTVFTQTYTGWPNWAHTDDTFGQTPQLNTMGALYLVQGNGNNTGNVHTYISYRFVDIQLWCPRPGLRVEPPTP